MFAVTDWPGATSFYLDGLASLVQSKPLSLDLENLK